MIPTYAEQKELVNRKLAKSSIHEGIETFKYAKVVMYSYLWDTDEKLWECRGHSYDVETGELVVAAPRKSFNYLENDWWKDVALDTPVFIQKKYNGFLGCVSRHDGKLIYSTTGSTKSDFAKWVEEETREYTYFVNGSHTFLFEICHPDDPHIVNEDFGAHYLGCRDKITGNYYPNGDELQLCTLAEAIEEAKKVQHEGFMVWKQTDSTFSNPCKMKSPYYVGMKKLMRMTPKNVELMYNQGKVQSLPEEFSKLPGMIIDVWSKEEWLEFNDQERRVQLEDFYSDLEFNNKLAKYHE